MGSKCERESLEKFVQTMSGRMLRRLNCDQVDTKSLSILLQMFLLAAHDVLRLEDRVWRTATGTFVSELPCISWSRLVAFLRESDQGYMDILRSLDETSAVNLSFTAFKQRYCERMRDAGFDGSYLPKAILELMYAYVKDRDVTVFARVHQLFQFPLRPDVLKHEARQELKTAVETKFKDLEYQLLFHPVVYDPGQFFQKYLKDYDPWEDFIPKFSNGSARISPDRNSAFWYDKVSMVQDRSLRQLRTDAMELNLPLRPTSDVSRFFPVPKDSSKMRGITIEPADMTYLQQGFLRSLRRYIRSHPYLSRRIDFWRPELNVNLAREGSIDGSYDTIDLSDASDSVLWDQVRADCDGLRLLQALDLVRSRETIMSDGTRIGLQKFAGMGNALTFPLECLQFCKIVEQGIRDVGGSVPKSRYRVYGDDIIVEHAFYGGVVAALERNGFKVNKTKSFDSQWWRFRESCGGEFVDGQDVCPVRLPRGPFRSPDNQSDDQSSYNTWVGTYIDIANSCYGRLPSVRLFIIHLMFSRLPKRQLPVFTRDGNVGLRSSQPTNFHLERVAPSATSGWQAYQYDELIFHGTNHVRKEIDESISDDVLYEYRLNQLALRSDSSASEVPDDVANRVHTELCAFGSSLTLRLAMLERIQPFVGESVDNRSRPTGTAWKSTCEPDFYSG